MAALRRQTRVTHEVNLIIVNDLLGTIKPRQERKPRRPKTIVSRGHVDRVYFSQVDKTWHLEDSDLERVQSAKHPQAPGDKVNFGCHMTAVVHRNALGETRGTVTPTSPAEDRQAWHTVNREIHQAQLNARLISNSDLPKRTVKLERINATTYALNVRQVLWDGQWLSYECDGFIN